MATCGRHGMLYGYFLGVCKRHVYDKCHRDLQVPTEGGEMYEYLERHVSSIYGGSYAEIISSRRYPTYIKECLLPENRVINVDNLDVAMYFKILELLGEEVEHLVRKRNALCHVPVALLRRALTDRQFNMDLHLMMENLQAAGIDKELLKKVETEMRYIIR